MHPPDSHTWRPKESNHPCESYQTRSPRPRGHFKHEMRKELPPTQRLSIKDPKDGKRRSRVPNMPCCRLNFEGRTPLNCAIQCQTFLKTLIPKHLLSDVVPIAGVSFQATQQIICNLELLRTMVNWPAV